MASDNEASCESDPNFAVICAFMDKFGEKCGLTNVGFLDLQYMLENNNEVSQQLIDLHVKLLRKARKSVSSERWERALIKVCQSFHSPDAREIERFGYRNARLPAKLRILKLLLEMQFDFNSKFKSEINKMSANDLRSEPEGRDRLGHAYWVQTDENLQVRVYKEDPDEETWDLVAKDREGWKSLIEQLKEGKEDVVNEDSNSLEFEKPVLDTGQTEQSSDNTDKEDTNFKLEPPLDDADNKEDDLKLGPAVTNTIPCIDLEKKLSDKENTDESANQTPVESLEQPININPTANGLNAKETLPEKKEEKVIDKVEENIDQLSFSNPTTLETIAKPESESIEDSYAKDTASSDDKIEEQTELESNTVVKIVSHADPSNKTIEIEPQNSVVTSHSGLNLTTKSGSDTPAPDSKRLETLGVKEKYMRCDLSSVSSLVHHRKAVDSAGYSVHTKYLKSRMEATEEEPKEPSYLKRPRLERPTLLGYRKKRKFSSESSFDEEEEQCVSDEIEEPLMLVKGEGAGHENKGENIYRKQSIIKGCSPIISDVVEETIMYFQGEGSGYECETGNERVDNKECSTSEDTGTNNDSLASKPEKINDRTETRTNKVENNVSEIESSPSELKPKRTRKNSQMSNHEEVVLKNVKTDKVISSQNNSRLKNVNNKLGSASLKDVSKLKNSESDGLEESSTDKKFSKYLEEKARNKLNCNSLDTVNTRRPSAKLGPKKILNYKSKDINAKRFNKTDNLKVDVNEGVSKAKCDDSIKNDKNNVDSQAKNNIKSNANAVVKNSSIINGSDNNVITNTMLNETSVVAEVTIKASSKTRSAQNNSNKLEKTKTTTVKPNNKFSKAKSLTINSNCLQNDESDANNVDPNTKQDVILKEVMDESHPKTDDNDQATKTIEKNNEKNTNEVEETNNRLNNIEDTDDDMEIDDSVNHKTIDIITIDRQIMKPYEINTSEPIEMKCITVEQKTIDDMKNTTQENVLVDEPKCVKTKVPLLTCIDIDKLKESDNTKDVSLNEDVKSIKRDTKPTTSDSESNGKSSDVVIFGDSEPLTLSEESDRVQKPPKPATLSAFKIDDDIEESIPAARVTRKRTAEKVSAENENRKRPKIKAKRPLDHNLRRSIEEQKLQEISSSDDDSSENKLPRILKKKSKHVSKHKSDNYSPEQSSDIVSDSSNAQSFKKRTKPTPRKKTLLGLDLPSERGGTDESDLVTGIRQSRRIAQLKIKEEAERRKLEELALQEHKEEQRKRKSKKSHDKDYKSEKRKHIKPVTSEDESTNDVDSEEKKKRKRKRKHKEFDARNPWKSSSGSSSSEVEEEEEEAEPEEDFNRNMRSDHEFSPESDLEGDTEWMPLKRARTVRKEVIESEADERVDDCPCQKCGKSDHPEWILLCDKCDFGWHCSCLRPPLLVIPEGNWFCPPCQHKALVLNLETKLLEYDKMLNKKEIEVRRKERLAYVGISLDNVLPAKEHDEKRPKLHALHKRSSGSESESELSGSESKSSSSSFSASDSEPIYQLRERRQAHSYRFNDYDELINSAIQEEMDAAKGVANVVSRGKDISTIVNAEKEVVPNNLEPNVGVEDVAAVAAPVESVQEPLPPVVPIETTAASSHDSDDEPIIRPVKKLIGRKKHRKLNSLDISSGDDAESDEDFKGSSSSESEEDFDEDEYGSSESSENDARKRKKDYGPIRRSTRARVSRYDRDFIDDSDSGGGKSRKKKFRTQWEYSETEEESDGSWGRKKRRGGRSRRKPATKSKKKKSKRKRRNNDSDPEVYRRKPNIKYGGLNTHDEIESRRTRGKKINYVEALGTDSEEELRRKPPKVEESEDEYIVQEDEEFKNHLSRDKNSDDSDVETALQGIPTVSHTKPKGKGKTGLKLARNMQEEVPLFPPVGADVPILQPDAAKISMDIPVVQPNLQMLEQEILDTDDEPNPIELINKNVEAMNEQEMKKMMEEEDYANKQLQLLALQIEKERKRKEREAQRLKLSQVQSMVVPPQNILEQNTAILTQNIPVQLPTPTQNVPVQTQTLVVQPQSLSVQPQSIPAQPQPVPVQLQALPVKLQALPVQTPNLPIQSQNKPIPLPNIPPIHPQNIPLQSQNTPHPSQNMALPQPQNIPLHSQNIPLQSPNVLVPPPNLPQQSLNLSVQPQNIPPQPQSVPMQMHSIQSQNMPIQVQNPTLPPQLQITPVTPKKRGRKPKSQAPTLIPSNNSISSSNDLVDSMGMALPTSVVDANTTPTKRRGRGKGKKTLAAEAAASAAGGSTDSPEVERNVASPIPGSPINASKLVVAAPPQPFSQSQPAPSVITRMLQSQPAQKYFSGFAGPRGPYPQGPPHYPVVRGGPPPGPRLPQGLPPPMYHPHRTMDPSPSGGGQINLPPTTTAAGKPGSPLSKVDPPPYTTSTPVGHFPPHLHHRISNVPPPFHPGSQPPNFYGSFGPPPPPATVNSGTPPPPSTYSNPSYDDQYASDNAEGSPTPLASQTDNSNSKQFEEETGGEFGGLVSYFSSQQEDDLDT